MVVNEIEIEHQLKEVGNRLLNPPSSNDELLNLLDKLELLLINVEQAPSISIKDALLPCMKAMISTTLLKSPDTDVNVFVTSCFSELTRITAPDAPYNDDHMKEIFHLTVAAFEKLASFSGRCYMKAVSILDTVAKVRSCLIMLDLKLDELIVKMFELFLKIIRSDHPDYVFSAMETIMTLIINESDEISSDLLATVLTSVRKENQSASPIAWRLGGKVIINSAAKLKPYLKDVMECGRTFEEYAPIVASICQDESHTAADDRVKGSRDHLESKEGLSPDGASPGEILHVEDVIPSLVSKGNASARNADNGVNVNSTKGLEHGTEVQGNSDPKAKVETEPVTVASKRGRKPNSLLNPDEGYDHRWITMGRRGAKLPRDRKLPDKGMDFHVENPIPKKINPPETDGIVDSSTPPSERRIPGGIQHKRHQLEKIVSTTNQDAGPGSLQVLDDPSHEDKAPSEYEVSLRKHSGGRSSTELKQQMRSRKLGLAVKTNKKTSLFPTSLSSDDFLTEPEAKPVHHSTQIEARNKKRSLDQTDFRRTLVIGISNVAFAEQLRNKKSKSSVRDRNRREELSKNLKRRRMPRKEVGPDTPGLDEQLVGSRIKVWWPMDKVFYEGVVKSFNPIKKKHMVLYADGEVELLNLRSERWELIEEVDVKPDEEQLTHVMKSDYSLEKPRDGKVKVKSASAKLKIDRKLHGAASVSNGKAKSSRSKFTCGAMRNESGAEGGGRSSKKKMKLKGTMVNVKSEPITLEDEKSPDNGTLRAAVEKASPSDDASPRGPDEVSGIGTLKVDTVTKRKDTKEQS